MTQSTADFSWTPDDDGEYVVTLGIRDDDMAIGTEVIIVRTLSVSNVAPSAAAIILPSAEIYEGDLFEIRLDDPSDANADLLAGFTYSFDLNGDGVFEIVDVSSESQTVSFATSGSRTLRARIRDKDGGSREYQWNVNIQNVAPVVTSWTGPTIANQQDSVVLTGQFVDPGLDSWRGTAVIHRVGDAFQWSVPVSLQPDKTLHLVHQFGLPGDYTVTVMVTDHESGAPISQTHAIQILNVAPILDLGPTGYSKAARAFQRTAAFIDPGDDSWVVTVDYDTSDSAPGVPVPVDRSTRLFSLDHTYPSAGTYTIEVSVFDGSVTTTSTMSVVVAPNLAPQVAAAIPTLTVLEGFSVSAGFADLATKFIDPDGQIDELTYSIIGNTFSSMVTPVITNHMLALRFDTGLSGSATIQVRATDIAGDYVDQSFEVIVIASDTTAPISHVLPLPPKASSLSIPITATGSDPNGPLNSQVSGVREFDLYVAEGGGSFYKFATVPISNPTTIFQAQSNRNYFFRSVARDNVGNEEFEPNATADAQISVGDFDAPETQVTDVTHNAFGLFTISMTGSDTGGSQLRYFDLYVSVDGGTAELVSSSSGGSPNAQGVYNAVATYQGKTDGIEHTYRFFSVGRDSSGNIESAPSLDDDVIQTHTFAPLGLVATGIDVHLGGQQRSYIRYLDVLFSTEEELQELLVPGRIKVERFSLNAADVTPETGIAVTSFSVVKLGDRLRLDFGTNGITGNRNTNAGDGFYRVLADTNRDGDFSDAADGVYEFARILGDVDGNASVTQADLDLVNAQIGVTGSNVNADVNGDGVVNIQDRNLTTSQKNLNRKLADHLKPLLDD